jgi:hypothetical protein
MIYICKICESDYHRLSTSVSTARNGGQPLIKPFVRVAIAPVFARFKRLDYRVCRRVKMLRSMTVGTIVAAADMPAKLADSQVDPPAYYSEAFLTPGGAWRDGNDRTYVLAAFHGIRKTSAKYRVPKYYACLTASSNTFVLDPSMAFTSP